ncbi:hypothetical protein [Photobacterium sanguinicancri]|uniref:Integrase n=1 Tax=Photobacterium sanguinicancri TaxID=875932 RepID=A0ABX4FSZ2_9GAMM|nr:hypothetical protein [Photobacterium sanguinicancri]OZS41881.1 hypothetical protein ASV53_21365 [Photobacterium sanguinicancri]
MTLLNIVNNLREKTTRHSDRTALNKVMEFLENKGWSEMLPSEFGEFEFLQFINHLSNSSPSVVYHNSTASRRLLQNLHAEGEIFQSSPELWPASQKPTARHFEPLSDEKTKALREWLKVEIDRISGIEKKVEESLKSGVALKYCGNDFRNKANKDPRLMAYNRWTSNLSDVIATIYLAHPDYPLNKEAVKKHYTPPRDIVYEELTNPLITIIKRMSIQNIPSYCEFLEDAKDLTFTKLLTYIYPDQFELITIKTAISLQTGWTFDVIDRIDAENYLYTPIPVNGDWAFVQAPKIKGAKSSNSTTNEQRILLHPCSISNPHSVYNLIKLLKKRTSRLRYGDEYKDVVNTLGCHPLFICLNTHSKSLLVHHTDMRSEAGAIKSGKNRKQIKEQFIKSLGFYFDPRQLRPTRLYLNEKEKNLPLILQVALFGHSSSAVTDEFYKNNAQFKKLRSKRLAKELIKIEKSIADGSFKGSLVPLREEKTIEDRILNIYTNHSGESPLAVCNDPHRPDWGSYIGERLKQPCRQFNKCLQCSRSEVLSDNIPFIVDRYLYLDQKKRTMKKEQFNALYLDEFNASKEVVESYPYQDEIKEAELRWAIEGDLLPPVISELGSWE